MKVRYMRLMKYKNKVNIYEPPSKSKTKILSPPLKLLFVPP